MPFAAAMLRCIVAHLLLCFTGYALRRKSDSRIKAYCAHQIAEGVEGRLPNWAGSLELVTVAVVTRHGERSAFVPIRGAFKNASYFSCVAEDLDDFWQSLPGKFRILNATTANEITRPLRPKLLKASKHSDECAPGQLTAEGFRQHQQLGQYLRAVYPQLLNSLNLSNFYARSTNFTRTIGSGMALLSEALKGSWPERIPLWVNDREHLPLSICPSAVTASKKQQDAWVMPRSVATSLTNLFGKGVQEQDTFVVMDSVVARSCAGLPLPCGNGGCADDVLAKDLLDSADQLMCKMFAGDQGGEFATFRAMYPFMLELVERLRDDAKRWLAGGGASFSLYSSHETVVAPLLSALGAYQERCNIPGYASRVVFELWQAPVAKLTVDTKKDNNSSFFVRILYNGHALQSIRGCGKQELCPLEDLAASVTSLLEGAVSWADACETSS